MLSKLLLKLPIGALAILSFYVPTMATTTPLSISKTKTVRTDEPTKTKGATNETPPCDNDILAPTFTYFPSDTTIYVPFSQEGTAVVAWKEPTATDNCSARVERNPNSKANGSRFAYGKHTIQYSAKDNANNATNRTFDVMVIGVCQGETVQPTVVSCPSDMVLPTTTNCAAATWAEPTFSDNCTAVSELYTMMYSSPTSDMTNGACFPVGATTVNYRVLDKNGNTSNCIFRVIVTNPCFNETTAPVFAGCPAHISLSTTTSCKIVTWTDPTAADNCSANPSVLLTSGLASGSCFPSGTTTVVYTATDDNNNTSTCSFDVVVTLQQIANGNLINNGSFEMGLDGFSNLGNTTTTSDVSDGFMAAQIGTAAGGLSLTQNAIPNNSYTFKAWNKIEGAVTGAIMGIKFFDETMKLLAGSTTVPITTTTYQEQVINTIAPPNAVTMQIYMIKPLATGYVFTDNWSLSTAISSCGRVFDPNKYYQIINRNSGKLLQIYGSSVLNEAPTVLSELSNAQSQQWRLVSEGFGFYEVIARHSNKPLVNNSKSSNSVINQGAAVSDSAKDWFFECLNNGYYRITHRLSSQVVENFNPEVGSKSSIYTWDGGTYQQWAVIECGNIAPNGVFSVVSNNSNSVSGAKSSYDFSGGITSEERMKDEVNRYARLHQRPTTLKSGKLTAFPNPANDITKIDLSAYTGRAVQLSLFNGFGQAVLTKHIESANTDLVEIDVTSLPVGTYLIKAQISGLRDITQLLIVGK